MNKKSIELTKEQRAELEEMIKKGKASVCKIQHAQVLLKIDRGESGPHWSDQQVQEAFGVSIATIWRLRQCFAGAGTLRCTQSSPSTRMSREEKNG